MNSAVRRRGLFGRVIRVVILVLVGFGAIVPAATDLAPAWAAPAAQDVPEPPALVATYFESPLTGSDIFQPDTCPTGGGKGENVDEGFKLTVRGRCIDRATGAGVAVRAREIAVGDGDVSIDFKVTAGAERAGLNLYVRIQGNSYDAAYLSFGSGQAELFKRDAGGNHQVAWRQGIGEVDPTNWNRLALRFVGEEVWLLINDEPMLYGAGMLNQNGGIGLQVVREGDPDDGDEVTVIFRDLTLAGFQELPTEEPAPDSDESVQSPASALRP